MRRQEGRERCSRTSDPKRKVARSYQTGNEGKPQGVEEVVAEVESRI